jgi:hypothetical protein
MISAGEKASLGRIYWSAFGEVANVYCDFGARAGEFVCVLSRVGIKSWYRVFIKG